LSILSFLAVYFVIWWLTLFVILPIGMKTQAEADDVVPGSVESAPARFRGGKVVLITTLVSAVIYGAWYVATTYLGIGLDSLPSILPKFD
jgi:predicted secreted protein